LSKTQEDARHIQAQEAFLGGSLLSNSILLTKVVLTII